MDWTYKLLIMLASVLLIFTVPLAFASPHFMHEPPQESFYKTMGFYTHTKDVPTICIMQTEKRDLMFEYAVTASSKILNNHLPQELHTSVMVMPYSEHKDLNTNDYEECFVFVLKEASDSNNFATTEFFQGYRYITFNNFTNNFADMLYISTHEIIHAVYGLEHLNCIDDNPCNGIMMPQYNAGSNYNLTYGDIDAIVRMNDMVKDNNVEFLPHWISFN